MLYAFCFYRESPVCESGEEKQLQNDSTQHQLQLLDIPSIDRSSPDGQEFEQLLLLPPHHHQARVASKFHLPISCRKNSHVLFIECSAYGLKIITVKKFNSNSQKRKKTRNFLLLTHLEAVTFPPLSYRLGGHGETKRENEEKLVSKFYSRKKAEVGDRWWMWGGGGRSTFTYLFPTISCSNS
jgi:hypothetical protein